MKRNKIIRINKFGKLHGYLVRDMGVFVGSGVIVALLGVLTWLQTPPSVPVSPLGTPVYATDNDIVIDPSPTPTPGLTSKAKVTAYSCGGITTEAQKLMNCPNGITTSGTVPKTGKTVACARNLLGKRVYIEGIGERTCEDTGGAIKTHNIDLYLDTIQEAYQWGVKYLSYEVL